MVKKQKKTMNLLINSNDLKCSQIGIPKYINYKSYSYYNDEHKETKAKPKETKMWHRIIKHIIFIIIINIYGLHLPNKITQ